MATHIQGLFERLTRARTGRNAILRIVRDGVRESLELDYKELTRKGQRIIDGTFPGELRNVLAKATSAMANTNGGIILWGVECKNHVPVRLEPVPHIHQVVERMKETTPGITDPPCPIEHVAIADSKGVGFAVSYVPRAERRPVAASCSDVNGYFMRSADSSVRMPHTMVEALVLSRARPELQLHVEPLSVRCIRAEPNPVPNAPYLLRPVYALEGHLNIENAGLAIALRAAIIMFDGPGIFKHRWIKHIPGGHTFHEGIWLDSSTYALSSDDVIYPGHRFSMGGFSIETRSLKSQSIEMKYSLVAEGFSASRSSQFSITPSELEGYAAAQERADELMQSE